MIVVIVALVVAVVLVAGVLLARRGAAAVEGRVNARLGALDVVQQAKASLDGSRGVLVLTPAELVFVRFVPDEELHLPRASLAATATDGALVVTSGEEERTFVVADAPAWVAALS